MIFQKLSILKSSFRKKNDQIEAQNKEYRRINEELIKAKERAEESEKLKTAFLHNISHEVRTPMNAILGFSNLMVINYNDREKIGRYAQILNQRCYDLLEIINGILDMSRIESGQLFQNIEHFKIFELNNEIYEFFKIYQSQMGKKHIDFSLTTECDSDTIIITDKMKLKQIYINLIGNAFKFTEKGFIRAGCRFDENNKLKFYVSDSGVGIPIDKHHKVFERFVQVNQSCRQNDGTGLGLSIVKGLVDFLGGEITLESELGKGSSFTFSIPYRLKKQNLPI